MKARTIAATLSVLLVSGCGIESAEQVFQLAPPLGLTATVVANDICLSWWCENTETYFDSFKVYVAMDSNSTVVVNGIQDGNFISNVNGDPSLPTLANIKPVSAPTNIVLYLSSYYTGAPFTNGLLYYFYVKSYSTSKQILSPSSDIASVVYSNLELQSIMREDQAMRQVKPAFSFSPVR
jgi:hypothetical protein